MKKALVGVLVLSLVVGFSYAGGAYGGFGGGGYRQMPANPGWDRPYFGDDLNLNEEQEEQLYEIQDNYFDKQEDILEELWDKQNELRELVFSNGDSQEVEKLKDEINSLQRDLLDLKIERFNEIKSVLTPEQIEVLKSFLEDFDYHHNFFQGPGTGFRRPGGGMWSPRSRRGFGPGFGNCPYF